MCYGLNFQFTYTLHILDIKRYLVLFNTGVRRKEYFCRMINCGYIKHIFLQLPRSQKKKKKFDIFNLFKEKKADILCLQETHFVENMEKIYLL